MGKCLFKPHGLAQATQGQQDCVRACMTSYHALPVVCPLDFPGLTGACPEGESLDLTVSVTSYGAGYSHCVSHCLDSSPNHCCTHDSDCGDGNENTADRCIDSICQHPAKIACATAADCFDQSCRCLDTGCAEVQCYGACVGLWDCADNSGTGHGNYCFPLEIAQENAACTFFKGTCFAAAECNDLALCAPAAGAAPACQPDGNECTIEGACNPQTGECQVQNAVDHASCSGPDECKRYECVSGQCVIADHGALDGSRCAADDYCGVHMCVGGQCVMVGTLPAGTPCPAYGDQNDCMVHRCDSSGTCTTAESVPDATPCETVCNTGACAGGSCTSLQPNPDFAPCSGSQPCGRYACIAGACRDMGAFLADGTPCSTGNACRLEACRSGECAFTSLAPNGAECHGDGSCTDWACVAGICQADRSQCGPFLGLFEPINTSVSRTEPLRMLPTGTGEILVRGFVLDDYRITHAKLYVNENAVDLQAGQFEVRLPLREAGGPRYVDNGIVLMAENELGARNVLRLPIRVEIEQFPDSLVIMVRQGLLAEDRLSLAELVGGTITDWFAPSAMMTIRLPEWSDLAAAAATLRQQPDVLASAIAFPLEEDAAPADFPNDPDYGKSGTWQLHHADPFVMYAHHYTCSLQEPCPNGQSCNFGTGFCDCSDDSECALGTSCATGMGQPLSSPPFGDTCPTGGSPGSCVACSRSGADIGWDESKDQIWEVMNAGQKITIAVLGVDGLFGWMHDDLKAGVWTSQMECCLPSQLVSGHCPDANPANGLPDCKAAEVRQQVELPEPCIPANCHECAMYKELMDPHHYVEMHIPWHGKCVKVQKDPYTGLGPDVGDLCASSSDCGFVDGECSCGTSAMSLCFCTKGAVPNICNSDDDCDLHSYCAEMGPFDLCTDGLPGYAGIDDDWDGYTDLEDPEVKDLIHNETTGLLRNGIDDDFSCHDNIFNPESLQADGVWDPVNNPNGCKDDPKEALLAAFDDDEDGYLDDIHGVDIPLGRAWGRLWETSHDQFVAREQNAHETPIAGLIGATVHNDFMLTGVSPNAQFMAVGYDTGQAARIMAWLAMKKAQVVNLSAGHLHDLFGEQFGGDETKYLAAIRDANREFHGVADPNALYVFSAGNDAIDLGLASDPLRGEVNGGFWRFPQNVTPRRVLVVGASNFWDRFSDVWYGCGGAQPPEACLADGGSTGSNYGPGAVDLAAPGEKMEEVNYADGQPPTMGYAHYSGTSFSAPIAAGAAAFLMSFDPPEFLRQPFRVIARLKQTVETVATDGSASFIGKTDAPGRVDLANAIDYAAYPLPPRPPFANSTWLLPDYQATQTTGAVLFAEQLPQGSATLLFRVYGGSTSENVAAYQPTLHVRFSGSFSDWTTLAVPVIPGYYSSVAAGDLDGDGCMDLVLAGYLDADPQSPVPGFPFRGRNDIVLLQQKVGPGVCRGFFDIGGSLPVPDSEVSRHVTLADLDQDGYLDILLPTAHWPYADQPIVGGSHRTRVYMGVGDGTFVDDSDLIELTAHLDGHVITACDLDGDGDLDLVEGGKHVPDPNEWTIQPRVFMNQLAETGAFSFGLDEAFYRGIPVVYFVHDIECADLNGDGKNDLLFARHQNAKNILCINTGSGHFMDLSDKLPGFPSQTPGFDHVHSVEWTQGISVCHMEGQPTVPMIFYANGDINNAYFQSNVVFSFGPGWIPVSQHQALGFDFGQTLDLSEEIVCADLDANGLTDAVFVANAPGRDQLYTYQGAP